MVPQGRFELSELGIILALAGSIFVMSSGPLALSILVSPEDIESGRVQLTPPCEYRARHGRPCPSCGLTRGFAAMTRLRFDQAAEFNPKTPYVYAGFVLIALVSGSIVGAAGMAVRRARRRERT